VLVTYGDDIVQDFSSTGHFRIINSDFANVPTIVPTAVRNAVTGFLIFKPVTGKKTGYRVTGYRLASLVFKQLDSCANKYYVGNTTAV
jgi:hypothetical protein